ncbi:MAG: hypothetical protein RSA73_06885, partial [Anaerovoracaceae bacterium]
LIFIFKGEKFFLQGFLENNGICTTYLDHWEPPVDDYIGLERVIQKIFLWKIFLNAKLWDNKSFCNTCHINIKTPKYQRLYW